MAPDDDGNDEPTHDLPTGPIIHVDVSRETVQKAVRVADEYGIALEDALARLTAYNFPADALSEPEEDSDSDEEQ